jgi:hypothetical protein
MRSGWLLVRRLGRHCFWHDPAVYRWFGILSGHGDCLKLDFDFWIDGYPGSASSMTAKAFQQANPISRIASRRHLPPFILNSLYNFKPGIFLIRKPEDAVISHAILSNTTLGECLDFYNDFHRVLVPNAPWLFVVPFEELMTRVATVTEAFNLHFGTSLIPPARSPASNIPESTGAQVAEISTSVDLKVARPLPNKPGIRQELRQRLRESKVLQRKLERARVLYQAFVPASQAVPKFSFDVTTRQLPAMA